METWRGATPYHADTDLPPSAEVDAITQRLRFSLSRNESGDVEVYSCQSRTMLVLPVCDVEILIDGIRGFLNDETERETISLCPISGKCESDRT